jgi:hypothetical protein
MSGAVRRQIVTKDVPVGSALCTDGAARWAREGTDFGGALAGTGRGQGDPLSYFASRRATWASNAGPRALDVTIRPVWSTKNMEGMLRMPYCTA